ncbi:MAG TPA: hypothetical protein VGQ97_03365 [Xanthobacteraceae bacterium]|nr:hypothetical protein [Xanthobacteraceae bacterium]
MRAYVFIRGGEIRLDGTDTKVWTQIVIQNFGKTPGYDFETWTNIQIDNPINPPFDKRGVPAQKSIIGPGADLNVPSQAIAISPAEHADIKSGKKVIIVWGEAAYRDAFKNKVTFVFRSINSKNEVVVSDNATGRTIWHGWGLQPHSTGYEERKG